MDQFGVMIIYVKESEDRGLATIFGYDIVGLVRSEHAIGNLADSPRASMPLSIVASARHNDSIVPAFPAFKDSPLCSCAV
jgi:hypothetical protein